MCGIAGVLARHAPSAAALTQVVRAMGRTLAHRGPDDDGEWTDADRGIGLAHRRLSVIDVSVGGHQPMTSACARYVLVYNGELYNHAALRRQLDPVAWRGGSDTETLLACFTRHGIEDSLERLRGMFALAVWDRDQRRLVLARDRMGEKPLYWGHLPGGDLVFGSELRALQAHPAWRGELDPVAIAAFMRGGVVPAPLSVWQGIGKLGAGEWLEVRRGGPVQVRRYWNLVQTAWTARGTAPPLDDATAVDTLERLLDDAVREQMQSDVPLGAFLSGGIDSSLIVAMMARHARRPVRTFTIGFDDPSFDEAPQARAVAAHLGTEHVEARVTGTDALTVVPELAQVYDEPFADASQIPTLLVARLAREQVTVALTGDGGDELFAGYPRYLVAQRMWPHLGRLPPALRRIAAGAIDRVRPATWSSLGRRWTGTHGHADLGGKIHKFARSMLVAGSREEMHALLMSHRHPGHASVAPGLQPRPGWHAGRAEHGRLSDVEFMCLMDQLDYLPDDILVKLDRAAMSVGLETRLPLLSPPIVDFAWQTPMQQKIRDGRGKWLLRQVLQRHVPAALVDRPKRGFFVPLSAWLRGPLRAWAHDLLDPALLARHGLLDAAGVARLWQEHLAGTRNWQYELWDVLMFQAWWLEHGAGCRRLAQDGAAVAGE